MDSAPAIGLEELTSSYFESAITLAPILYVFNKTSARTVPDFADTTPRRDT